MANINRHKLRQIESFADSLFQKYGIDIEFSKHFMHRVNDYRNKPKITDIELKAFFQKQAQRWGDNIARMDYDEEAVLTDLSTFLNVPFVIKPDSDNDGKRDALMKTAMRKQDFKSGPPTLAVENTQPITKQQLDALERAADKVFGKLGIDIEFTRHFLDRVNDERNIKQITIKELGMMFVKEYKKWGRSISKMPINSQAVMKDLSSELNIPFVLNKDGEEKDLVAKTVMRKKNFTTPDTELPVESVNEDGGSYEYQGRRRGVSTWIDGNDRIELNTWVDYKKAGRGSRLRDPGGTKWKLQIRDNGHEVFYKVVGDAESMKALDRKQKAVKAAINFMKKTYGIDAYNDLWIEGGLPKPSVDENINDSEQYYVAAKSPFWKRTKYVNYDDPRAYVMKGHVKHATAFSKEQAEKVAKSIEGGANKYVTTLEPVNNMTEEKHGAKKGTQVKGKDATPKTSKPSKSGEQPHPMRGKLVGEALTEDQQFIVQKGAWECEQLRERVMDPREAILRKALEYLDKLAASRGDKQDIGGYAFDIARSFNLDGIASAKELTQLYHDWKGLA